MGTRSYSYENFKCRLCYKTLKVNDVHYIYLNNEVTTLGQRLMAILNIEVNEMYEISHVCCEMCAFKVTDIFSMLMEIHASNIVMRRIYENSVEVSENGIFAMIEPELLKCDKCDEKISDMKSYTEHYEHHTILDMTSQNSEVFENKSFEDNLIETAEPVEPKNEYLIILKNEKISGDEMYGNDDSDDSLSDPEEYICHYCDRTFIDKLKLQKHIYNTHIVNGKIKSTATVCNYCKNVIPKGQIKDHISKCKADFESSEFVVCELCGKSVKTSNRYGHMRKHKEINGGGFNCPICNKKLKHKQGLRTHMILHDDSKKVICEICGELTHPWTLWKHNKRHAPKSAKCHICGKAYTYNYMLQYHLRTHEDEDKHLSNNLPVYECPQCDKKYSYIKMLNSHMQEVHEDKIEDVVMEADGTFKCKFCEKAFDDHYSLRNHLLLMHQPSKEDLRAVRGRPAFGVFHCTYCEAVLRSEYGLRAHLKKAHNLSNKEMPDLMRRTCESCGKSFADKQGLTTHIKSAHLKTSKLTCTLCGKTFDRYQSFANHKLQHTGQKPFECEVCLRTFRQRSDVVRHLQRHVRDGEATLEEANARNNSDSKKVRKSRIFLKDYFEIANDAIES